MSDLEELFNTLSQLGVSPNEIRKDPMAFKDKPSTAAGLYSLKKEGVVPDLAALGTTVSSKNGRANAVMYKQGRDDAYTRGHEYEHVLGNQGLGRASRINSKFDELVGDKESRKQLVKALVNHAPYLVKAYGLNPKETEGGYFSSKMYNYQQDFGLENNLLDEQLASLSSLEQRSRKRLVDDPYVRENILTTPAMREAYDAVTGLRQTRLDSKDLPPYTRVPEKKEKIPDSENNVPITDFLSKLLRKK